MAAGPHRGATGAADQAAARAWSAQEDREALQVLPDEARQDRGDNSLEGQRAVRHPVSECASNSLRQNLDHSAQDPKAKGLMTLPNLSVLRPSFPAGPPLAGSRVRVPPPVRPRAPAPYPGPLRRVRGPPPASAGRRPGEAPLRLASPSPPPGRAGAFPPQAAEHPRRLGRRNPPPN